MAILTLFLMRTLTLSAPVASSSDILTRLISAPPLMRADYFGSWLRDLASGRGPMTAERQVQVAEAPGGGQDLLPWEAPIFSVLNGVARVLISGPIVNGYDDFTCWYWGLASSDRIRAACVELAGRADVRSVLFVFNSPGGMAQGTPETAAAIAQLSDAKQTVAHTGSMCCSAAYWMASQCRLITATLTADVGSIGTYLAFYDWSGYLEKAGIKLELFARGTFKAMGIAGKSLTDEQRKFLDDGVTRTNDRFLAAVRSARPGVTDETMQGQCFDGEQAVAACLVDYVVSGPDEIEAALALVPQ